MTLLEPHGLQPTGLLCPWGFSRQEYWGGLPCLLPGDLPHPGIEPRSSVLSGRFFTTEPPGKPTKFSPCQGATGYGKQPAFLQVVKCTVLLRPSKAVRKDQSCRLAVRIPLRRCAMRSGEAMENAEGKGSWPLACCRRWPWEAFHRMINNTRGAHPKEKHLWPLPKWWSGNKTN